MGRIEVDLVGGVVELKAHGLLSLSAVEVVFKDGDQLCRAQKETTSAAANGRNGSFGAGSGPWRCGGFRFGKPKRDFPQGRLVEVGPGSVPGLIITGVAY